MEPQDGASRMEPQDGASGAEGSYLLFTFKPPRAYAFAALPPKGKGKINWTPFTFKPPPRAYAFAALPPHLRRIGLILLYKSWRPPPSSSFHT